MYNPFALREWGATAITAGTGYQAHQNGATPWEALNIGLWWRWWYRNLTFSFLILFTALVIACAGGTTYWWHFPAQILVTVWVFNITYVSLIDTSGFKQRWWYRVWAPLQHRWFPNVARFWWYTFLFFPSWLVVWYHLFFIAKGLHMDPTNTPPEWG